MVKDLKLLFAYVSHGNQSFKEDQLDDILFNHEGITFSYGTIFLNHLFGLHICTLQWKDVLKYLI